MDSVDNFHGLSGQFPWTQWTISMDSVDNVTGLSGQFPWTQWTLSMDIVQSTGSNIPAGQCPCKMSTESMDFQQTGDQPGHLPILIRVFTVPLNVISCL